MYVTMSFEDEEELFARWCTYVQLETDGRMGSWDSTNSLYTHMHRNTYLSILCPLWTCINANTRDTGRVLEAQWRPWRVTNPVAPFPMAYIPVFWKDY